MNSVTVLVVLGICIAFVSAGPTGEAGKKHPDMKCQGVDVKFTPDIINKTKTCFQGVKMEKGTDFSCPTLCKYQSLGVLDASGKVVADALSTFLKTVYPEAAVSDLTKSITTCVTEKGTNAAVKEENGNKDCSSFGDMFKCFMDGMRKVCKTEE